MKWIIERLKEVSTWRGLIVLLGLVGVSLSPEQAQAIVAAGLSIIAVVEVFRKETPAK
jgi:hypothetical protein